MSYFIKMIGLFIIAVLTLSGCTSYKEVAIKQTPLNTSHYYQTIPPLYSGDKVKYQLKNGQQGELTIERLTPQNLVARNGKALPMSQFNTLEKQEISTTKTAAAVGGGVVATTVVIGIILTVSVTTALVAAVAG